jgi:hypothetical protein
MSNANLVQKTITDKNGVTTKRWVKPAGNTAEAKKRLPSPAPATPSINAPRLVELMKLCPLGIRGYGPQIFDPRTVSAIEGILESRPPNSFDARSLIARPLYDFTPPRGSHQDLNNVGVFGEAILSNGGYKGSVDVYVRGLQKTKEFRHIKDFLLDATEEQRERAIALVTVANAAPEEWFINNNGYDKNGDEVEGWEPEDHHIGLKDEPKGLREFVMDHHEHTDEIVRIMHERASADLDMLARIIDGGALGEGAL